MHTAAAPPPNANSQMSFGDSGSSQNTQTDLFGSKNGANQSLNNSVAPGSVPPHEYAQNKTPRGRIYTHKNICL